MHRRPASSAFLNSIVALVVAACGTAPPASPGDSPLATLAPPSSTASTAATVNPEPSPTPTRSPTPQPVVTPDPTARRAAAAAAYLDAASTFMQGTRALNARYPNLTSLASARAYYRGLAALTNAFVAAVGRLDLSIDQALIASTLIEADVAVTGRASAGASAASFAAVVAVKTHLLGLELASEAAANALRSALGLPAIAPIRKGVRYQQR